VSFKEIVTPATAQISIGLVPLNQSGVGGYWNASDRGNWRVNATIKIKESIISSNELSIKSKTPFVDSDTFQRNWLIGMVQHELGNVLGLGDINPKSGIVSIQNDPFSLNAILIPLRESDVAMMRQHYGESTCPSTFTPAYKVAAELKAKQEADAKAAAELKAKQEAEAKAAAELKAKQEAEAKAAAELKAKQEAEAKAAAELKAKQEANAIAAASKKITITCIKGKLIKKVTAVKPKCASGYKVKKYESFQCRFESDRGHSVVILSIELKLQHEAILDCNGTDPGSGCPIQHTRKCCSHLECILSYGFVYTARSKPKF
jgi:hypothetical protein